MHRPGKFVRFVLGFQLPQYQVVRTGPRADQMNSGLVAPPIIGAAKRFAINGNDLAGGLSSECLDPARWVIPPSSRVQPLLEGHFSPHDTLGVKVRTIQYLVKRVANRAQISKPVTPHILRHTFSVTAIQKGISLPSLQRLLGHDNTNSLLKYVIILAKV
jgi:integrase/recombinase XerD